MHPMCTLSKVPSTLEYLLSSLKKLVSFTIIRGPWRNFYFKYVLWKHLTNTESDCLSVVGKESGRSQAMVDAHYLFQLTLVPVSKFLLESLVFRGEPDLLSSDRLLCWEWAAGREQGWVRTRHHSCGRENTQPLPPIQGSCVVLNCYLFPCYGCKEG